MFSKFSKILKTLVQLILNSARPHVITYTYHKFNFYYFFPKFLVQLKTSTAALFVYVVCRLLRSFDPVRPQGDTLPTGSLFNEKSGQNESVQLWDLDSDPSRECSTHVCGKVLYSYVQESECFNNTRSMVIVCKFLIHCTLCGLFRFVNITSGTRAMF